MATPQIKSTTVATMTDAAIKLVDSLSENQKLKACFHHPANKQAWISPKGYD